MRRVSLWSLLLVTVAATAASAQASGRASQGLSVSSGGETHPSGGYPPPPAIVIHEEPRTTRVQNSTVRVVEDRRISYDFFRYGVYWYIHDDGRWYRARAHRGPFRAIDVKYVPRAVITVPAKHWRAPQRPQSVATMKEMRHRARGGR